MHSPRKPTAARNVMHILVRGTLRTDVPFICIVNDFITNVAATDVLPSIGPNQPLHFLSSELHKRFPWIKSIVSPFVPRSVTPTEL